MIADAQKKALKNYRTRLNQRGIARFEVMAHDSDKDLIRALARRLTEAGPEASEIRIALRQAISTAPEPGGILKALRRSPLAGSGLNLERPRGKGRMIRL